MKVVAKPVFVAELLMISAIVGACSGLGAGSGPGPGSGGGPFAIGGTITGIVGTGMVLQDNGKDNLTINSSGAFAFATPLASNAAYSVTIMTQPSNPAQTCTVSGGSGTATAIVTTVQINCPAPPATAHGRRDGFRPIRYRTSPPKQRWR